MTRLRTITDDTPVAYDSNGNDVLAEKMQVWAYNQLAAAPELLEALKTIKNSIYMTNLDKKYLGIWRAFEQVEQAIEKAEG